MNIVDFWQPIITAPLDGSEFLVHYEMASIEMVSIAWYDTGEDDIEDEGFWTYLNSVSQIHLTDDLFPTHWAPYLKP